VGTTEPDADVTLYTTADCSGAEAASGTADEAGAFSLEVAVSKASTTVFYGKAVDAAGNQGLCAAGGVEYVHEPCGNGVCVASAGETMESCPQDCTPSGFAYIPPGEFMMGSPSDEAGRNTDEGSQRTVQLTRGLWMKTTEVTQSDWKPMLAAMGGVEPSWWPCGDDCPTDGVNWWEALAYCNALSSSEGLDECFTLTGCDENKPGEDMECTGVTVNATDGNPLLCEGYRLPTEAEWEYAARAGSTTALYTGPLTIVGENNGPELDAIAWYGGNSEVSYQPSADCSGWPEKQHPTDRCATNPVGQKQANAWGLFDVLGNVQEWTWDFYEYSHYQVRFEALAGAPDVDPLGPSSSEYRTTRGGGWTISAARSRLTNRERDKPGTRNGGLGLRVVRTAPAAPACSTEADCDDRNACTVDECSDTACYHSPVVCDDGNPCTVDYCDASAGGSGCVYDAAVAAGQLCDAGPGAGSGACSEGQCVLDPCGNGSCVAAAGETASSCPQDCGPAGFAYIPPGELMMGSPADEAGRDSDEGPQRTVQITRGFWMQTTEVTQGEWKTQLTEMGGTVNPSAWPCGDDCPVEKVNWWEALAYCNALSSSAGLAECFTLTGCDANAPGENMQCTGVTVNAADGNVLLCEGYRLPTEAEWEYAARAGSDAALYTGPLTIMGENNGPELDPIAWYGGNSLVSYQGGYGGCTDWPERQYPADSCGPRPVGEKQANAWGLFDVLGNVFEWTWDSWESSYYQARVNALAGAADVDPLGPSSGAVRVFRGGSWDVAARRCRTASREDKAPGTRQGSLGLRVVRTAPTAPACSSEVDCDDRNPCTVDECSDTACYHSPVVCDDGNPCTVDYCDASAGGSGCVYDDAAADGLLCDAGPGAGSGACSQGACVLDPCGNGSCVAAAGETASSCPQDCGPAGFAYIAPGELLMGSPSDEPGRETDEGSSAPRTVQLTRGFWMKTTEVSQGEWKAMLTEMGGTVNPSSWPTCGDDCPVERVNWWEALAYCNAMSRSASLDECFTLTGCNSNPPGEGKECTGVTVNATDGNPLLCEGYRLPTEAEWEYAARAGSATALYTGALTIAGENNGPELDPIAWYGGNSLVSYDGGYAGCKDWPERQYPAEMCGPHPVGEKQANAWGLYDVLGNVWEWTWDFYEYHYYQQRLDALAGAPDVDPLGPASSDYHVVRGGNWTISAARCRLAKRERDRPETRGGTLGMRPVRTVSP